MRKTQSELQTFSSIVLVLFFLHASSIAQTHSEKDADAFYLDITHEYTLHPDGSTTYRYEHHLQLLTGFAFNRAYGESFVVYNPKWQTLKEIKSVTTMSDGRKVESPFNAYNEVLPGFALGVPSYLHLREMVITHTGLEKNAVVNFAYTLTTKPGMFPGLMGSVLFGDRSPIQKMTVRIKIPQKTILLFETMNQIIQPIKLSANEEGDPLGKPKIETTKDAKIYTWVVANIPLVPVESSQPPMEQFVPSLYFSTAGYEQIIQHVLGDERTVYSLSAKAKAVVNDIVGDAKTPADKAIALRSSVENNVALMNCDLSYLGHHAMTAQEVFDKNAGSQLDKSILLSAMCKVAGIDAVPCLCAVFTNLKPDQFQSTEEKNNVSVYSYSMSMHPDIPALQLFNSAVVLCKNLPGTMAPLYLDPNFPQNGIVNQRLLDKFILPLSKSEVEKKTFAANPELNVITSTSDWNLKSDGTFSGKTLSTASGIFNYAFNKNKFASLSKKAVEKSGQGCMAKEDESIATNENASCSVSVESKSALQPTGGIIRFALPGTPGGLNDLHIAVSTAQRTTPIDLPAPFKEECKLTLHVPDNYSSAVPDAMNITNDIGSLYIKFMSDGKGIEVSKTLSFNVARIMPEKYEQFLALVSAWQNAVYQSVVLTMKEK